MLHLLGNGFSDTDKLASAVNEHAGLLGVSGRTSDVRQLLEMQTDDRRADLALRMFCYQVRKAIAAMAAALGGIDQLVFTGGIGQHSTELREEICSSLAFLPKFEMLDVAFPGGFRDCKDHRKLAAWVS